MVDKFISMWKVRELADKVTNVVMNYTEIEGNLTLIMNRTNEVPATIPAEELVYPSTIRAVFQTRKLIFNVSVRELIDFIQDDDKLREKRKKAKKNKDKYIGMSADAMGTRMGGSTGSYNDNWDSSRRSGGGGGGSSRHGDRNWYSEHRSDRSDRSRGDYEDDYQYDGEREDSDVESSEPPTSASILHINTMLL